MFPISVVNNDVCVKCVSWTLFLVCVCVRFMCVHIIEILLYWAKIFSCTVVRRLCAISWHVKAWLEISSSIRAIHSSIIIPARWHCGHSWCATTDACICMRSAVLCEDGSESRARHFSWNIRCRPRGGMLTFVAVSERTCIGGKLESNCHRRKQSVHPECHCA